MRLRVNRGTTPAFTAWIYISTGIGLVLIELMPGSNSHDSVFDGSQIMLGLGCLLVALGIVVLILTKHRPHIFDRNRPDDIVARALRLMDTDPPAAHRLLASHFAKAEERINREREELRQRAPFDLDAARQLEGVLRKELEGHQAMRRGFLPTVPTDKRAGVEASIDAREGKTRSELLEIESTIARLRS